MNTLTRTLHPVTAGNVPRDRSASGTASENAHRCVEATAEIDTPGVKDDSGITKQKAHYIVDPGNFPGSDFGVGNRQLRKSRKVRKILKHRTQQLALEVWHRLRGARGSGP